MISDEQRNQLCQLLYVLDRSYRFYAGSASEHPAALPPQQHALHQDLVWRTALQTRELLDNDSRKRDLRLQHVPPTPDAAPGATPDAVNDRAKQLADELRARRALHAPTRPRPGGSP